MYKVTLSMPIYNVAPYVERALLSALNQTFDSIEFLIVDDRGTDNSMEIVRRIIKDHPRGKDVRIIEHPHNIGLGATRNTAIDNAQGEYLFFMDSDDEITQDCIEILYKAMMEDQPVDFVVASYDMVDMDGHFLNRKCYYKNITIRGEMVIPEKVYSKKLSIFVATWNKLYSLAFLRKNNIRCFPHHINEDAVFFLLILYFSRSCKIISNITLKYYQRDNSIEYYRKNNFSIKNANEFTEIFDIYKRYLDLYKNTSVYKFFIIHLMSIISYNCVLLFKSNSISSKEKNEYYEKWRKFDISSIELIKLLPFSLKNILFILMMTKKIFVNVLSVFKSVK